MEEIQKPIKVLHVTFNMDVGGSERVIFQLLEHIPVEEVINEVVCIDGFVGQMGKALGLDNFPVHVLSRKEGFDWRLVLRLREIITRRRIDIVHCHQYTPFFYGWLASLGKKARVIFTEHGRFYPDRYRNKARLVNPLMVRTSSAVIAISNATREALVTYEFMPKKYIEVIYNGVEPLKPDEDKGRSLRKSLGIGDSDFVLGTVSRLDPVKNQKMMLRAFRHFLSRHSNSWLIVVGDGPERTKLEDYSRELGIAKRIIFTGFQAQPVVYLRAIDCFLLSSFTEGTSMTLLEAMSLGIPSIVTSVGGNPEIVKDEQTGLLVPSDNSNAMGTAIERLYADEAFRKDLSRNSLSKFYASFSADTMADAYVKCYQRSMECS